jgi:hypothetical protein
MKSRAFSDEEFWAAFRRDLEMAKAQIIIQSPFISAHRLKVLGTVMRNLIKNGISVCLFVQEPRYWEASLTAVLPEFAVKIQEMKSHIQLLQSWGIHVNLRKGVHEKFALIDLEILWEGSLNILSHINTKEHMRRWKSEGVAREILVKYGLAECKQCETNKRQYGISSGDLHKLGGFLAMQRTNRSLTQRSLAKDCGLPHSRIRQVEEGNNVTMATIYKITEELDLDVVFVPKKLSPSTTEFLKRSK